MRQIDADTLFDFLTEQLDKETGAFSKGRNVGINIARSALHDKAITPTIAPPPNNPLTLEQLREMNGEPVFCRSLLTGEEGWAICRIAECGEKWYLAFSGGEQAYGDKDTIGRNWIAFRHKPEEGTT